MPVLPDLLPESLIVDCANQLGAVKIPIEAIQEAWKSVANSSFLGCLHNENGKRLFIAYRLRELGCFPAGCQEDVELGSGCLFHFFDIYSNTRNLTEEEYAEFMTSRRKYREQEAKWAATKLWQLIDSHPVNRVAARATGFNRDGTGK